jgi:hypothetical protein
MTVVTPVQGIPDPVVRTALARGRNSHENVPPRVRPEVAATADMGEY